MTYFHPNKEKERRGSKSIIYLRKRSFGLPYKDFDVHIELLSAHILHGDSCLPQFPNQFITSYLPCTDSLF